MFKGMLKEYVQRGYVQRDMSMSVSKCHIKECMYKVVCPRSYVMMCKSQMICSSGYEQEVMSKGIMLK